MKPTKIEITNNTNTTKAILAKPTDTDIMPPKPDIATTIATTKKITDQYNIIMEHIIYYLPKPSKANNQLVRNYS